MRVVVVTALLIGGLSMAHAQQPEGTPPPRKQEQKSPEERAKKKADHLAKKLELTDEQRAQVETANLKAMKELDVVKKKAREDREASKARAKEVRAMHDDEIRSVLTEEQIQVWEQLKAEKEEKRREQREKRKAMKESKPTPEQE